MYLYVKEILNSFNPMKNINQIINFNYRITCMDVLINYIDNSKIKIWHDIILPVWV